MVQDHKFSTRYQQRLHKLIALLSAGLLVDDALKVSEIFDDLPATKKPPRHISGILKPHGNTYPKWLTQLDELIQEHPEYSGLLTALYLSREFGIPLADIFQHVLSEQVWLAKMKQQSQTAALQSKATLSLIVLLPFLVVFLSQSMGLNIFSTITMFPILFIPIIIGLLLLVQCFRWVKKIMAPFQQIPSDPAFAFLLVQEVLKTGTSLTVAQDAVARALLTPKNQHPPEHLFQHFSGSELAKQYGIPLTNLLLAEAELARKEHQQYWDTQLVALPMKLLLPLGLTALPGFILLTVVPVAFSFLISSQMITP